MLMIKAYDEKLNDQWKIGRSLEYLVYCLMTKEGERVSIFEYKPLPGDPTKEEVAVLETLRKKQRVKEISDRVDKAKKKYKNRKEKNG